MESKRIMPVSHFGLVKLTTGDSVAVSIPVQAAGDGFSLYVRGRLAEDLPLYAQRRDARCGIAQHLAAVSALDKCYQVEPSAKALNVRHALAYLGVYFDHLKQLFMSRPNGTDGISSLVSTNDGLDANDVLDALRATARAIEILGGRGVTPERVIPSGLTKGISDEELVVTKDISSKLLSFSLRVEEAFRGSSVEWVKKQEIHTEAYSLATVDDQGACSFYGGTLRIVDPKGAEFAKGNAKKILAKVSNWKEDLPLRVGVLARLNVGCQPSTPHAKHSQDELLQALGKPPIHLAAAGHWATVIELVQAAELLAQKVEELETGGLDINSSLSGPVEGVAAVEGACGTVIHRYVLDEQGLVTEAQIAPTGKVLVSELSAAISAVLDDSKHKVTAQTADQIAQVIAAYQPAFAPEAGFSVLITNQDEKGKMIEQWRKP